MYKSVKIVSSLFFLLIFIINIPAYGATNVTFNGISKIYIEYENGQYQVINLPAKINYPFVLDGSVGGAPVTTAGAEVPLTLSDNLNENSNIKRIGLYVDSIEASGFGTRTINGYLKMVNNGSTAGYLFDWTTGDASEPIVDWCSGYVKIANIGASNFNNGIVDFNSYITFTEAGTVNATLSVNAGPAIDAKNKKVQMCIQGVAAMLGGITQTQNL
jgi:hypothetical protein